MAIAWGHKFPFANRPVIVVQLFSLNATALGQYQIVSGFAGGQGSSISPPRHPLVKLNADSTAIIVVYNQAKTLDTTPNSDVLSKTIPLSELTEPPGPVCSDDVMTVPEDTVAVIRPDQLLGNDINPGDDVLTVVRLKLLPGRSSLIRSQAGPVLTTTDARGAPVTDPGTLEMLHSTVTRPGLRAVYYLAEEILDDMAVRSVGPALQTASLADFDRLDFEAPPNTVKFPPDIVGTLPTLRQTATGNPPPPPTSTSGRPALTVTSAAGTSRPGDPGFCRVNGNCVTNTHPTEERGFYGNGESCVIQVLRVGTLTATAFETQVNHDHVVVGGQRYSGTVGPDGVAVAVGDEFTWRSDNSTRRSGWTICWGAEAAPRSLAPWAGLPAFMTSNYFAAVTGTITLYQAENSVEFLVSANSAAALYIDDNLVMISRERRARSGEFVSGFLGPGEFIAGTGLVSALAAGRHTVRLHYYSSSPATQPRQGRAVVQTYEFEVLWRRQSNAAFCGLGTCYNPAIFNNNSAPPPSDPISPAPTTLPTVGNSLDRGPITCGENVVGNTRIPGGNLRGNAANEHYYSFTIHEVEESVTFSTCGSAYDTFLRIYSADCSAELAACDDCGPCRVFTVLTATLPRGDYVLLVEGYMLQWTARTGST